MHQSQGRGYADYSIRNSAGLIRYPLKQYANEAYDSDSVTDTNTESFMFTTGTVVIRGMLIEAVVAATTFWSIIDVRDGSIMTFFIMSAATPGTLPRYIPFGPKGMVINHGIGWDTNNNSNIGTLFYDVIN